MMTKPKHSNWVKIKKNLIVKIKYVKKNYTLYIWLKDLNFTKLKMGRKKIATYINNSKCDKPQNLILWKRTWKLKLWLHSKTQIVAKLKVQNLSSNKTENSNYENTKKKSSSETTQFLTKILLVRTTLQLNNVLDVLSAAFWDIAVLFTIIANTHHSI